MLQSLRQFSAPLFQGAAESVVEASGMQLQYSAANLPLQPIGPPGATTAEHSEIPLTVAGITHSQIPAQSSPT